MAPKKPDDETSTQQLPLFEPPSNPLQNTGIMTNTPFSSSDTDPSVFSSHSKTSCTTILTSNTTSRDNRNLVHHNGPAESPQKTTPPPSPATDNNPRPDTTVHEGLVDTPTQSPAITPEKDHQGTSSQNTNTASSEHDSVASDMSSHSSSTGSPIPERFGKTLGPVPPHNRAPIAEMERRLTQKVKDHENMKDQITSQNEAYRNEITVQTTTNATMKARIDALEAQLQSTTEKLTNHRLDTRKIESNIEALTTQVKTAITPMQDTFEYRQL